MASFKLHTLIFTAGAENPQDLPSQRLTACRWPTSRSSYGSGTLGPEPSITYLPTYPTASRRSSLSTISGSTATRTSKDIMQSTA